MSLIGILSTFVIGQVFVPHASGQTASAIVGSVRDPSGAALPGVIVAASSPALISGTKEVITDTDGSYQLLDLRPGEYTVVFSIAGFRPVRREGVLLTSAFTATVNATMEIGDVQETVTVSGATPVVDFKSNVAGTVLTGELKEAVPTGRTAGALVALLPGVVQPRLDVGGTLGLLSASGGQVHGSDSNDVTWNRDGGDISSTRGGGGTSAGYYNEALNEEVSILTEALPAEIAAGGVSYNMISKTGGNSFSGSLFASGTSKRFQSDNLTDNLRQRGLTAPTRLKEMYDFNPAFGGRIIRDRWWFFSSFRRLVINRLAAGQFKPDGTQAPDDNNGYNMSFSSTWRIDQSNQLTGSYDRGWKYNLNTRTGASQCIPYPALVDDSATYQQPTFPRMGVLKWTSTLTDKLALEANAAHFNGTFTHPPNEPVGDLVRVDLARGLISGASPCEADDIPVRWSSAVVASYAPNWKGAHNIRTGVQFQRPTFREVIPSNDNRGDWAAYYRNGIPDSVRVFNLPTDLRHGWIDISLFIQDSWTIKDRLTLNVGVRFERLVGQVNHQTAPAGRWVGPRDFPKVPDTPNWTTVVPRLAFAYDLMGNGKTAIKGNVSQYTQRIGEGFMGAVNPMAPATDTRAWDDLNGDRVPQVNELGPSTGFTGGVGTVYAPGIRRPYQWEYTASIQHELLPSMALKLSYFRRTFANQIGVRNLAVPPEAYTPVTIVNPLTGGQLIVYNQDPATRADVNRVRDNYPGIERSYDGFEVVVDKRFTGQFMLLGGFTVGKKVGTVNTTDLNNPNLLVNNQGRLDNDSTYIGNVSGVWRLPGQFVLSGHFKHQTGFPQTRTYTVGRAQVPNLTQVTQNVALVPRGEVRLPSIDLLDLRVSRVFDLRSGRVKVEPLLDVYNVANLGVELSSVDTVGPNLGRVSDTLDGRIVRFGFKMSF
jgi:hypothetical protein